MGLCLPDWAEPSAHCRAKRMGQTPLRSAGPTQQYIHDHIRSSPARRRVGKDTSILPARCCARTRVMLQLLIRDELYSKQALKLDIGMLGMHATAGTRPGAPTSAALGVCAATACARALLAEVTDIPRRAPTNEHGCSHSLASGWGLNSRACWAQDVALTDTMLQRLLAVDPCKYPRIVVAGVGTPCSLAAALCWQGALQCLALLIKR